MDVSGHRLPTLTQLFDVPPLLVLVTTSSLPMRMPLLPITVGSGNRRAARLESRSTHHGSCPTIIRLLVRTAFDRNKRKHSLMILQMLMRPSARWMSLWDGLQYELFFHEFYVLPDMYCIFYAGSYLQSRVSASPEGHARKQTPRVHRTRNPTPQTYLVRLFRSQYLHEPPRSYVAFVSLTTCGAPITKEVIVEGGTDESNGKVKYTFTRPDGSQLGTQGPYDCRARLSSCSWH